MNLKANLLISAGLILAWNSALSQKIIGLFQRVNPAVVVIHTVERAV
jgi:hypothetical protein